MAIVNKNKKGLTKKNNSVLRTSKLKVAILQYDKTFFVKNPEKCFNWIIIISRNFNAKKVEKNYYFVKIVTKLWPKIFHKSFLELLYRKLIFKQKLLLPQYVFNLLKIFYAKHIEIDKVQTKLVIYLFSFSYRTMFLIKINLLLNVLLNSLKFPWIRLTFL